MSEDSAAKCEVPGIPDRLHRNAKPEVAEIPSEDLLYLFHTPLPVDEPYGSEIPEYRVRDQSANSHDLNPDGSPTDVLFNDETGERRVLQIARLDVASLIIVNLPNPNTRLVKKLPSGETVTTEDVYSVRVVHKPEKCNYPHCEIRTLKNGKELGKNWDNRWAKGTIRRRIAEIAQKSRKEMLAFWDGATGALSALPQ